MTSLAQLRKTALSLPETAEKNGRLGTVAFTVCEKRFALLDKDKYVQLRLPETDVDELLAQHPTAERPANGVRVPIGDINGQQLNYWVRRAWLSCAPERLAAQLAAADSAAAGDVGDLPRAIGRPATQALTSAGITTLDQVTELTDAELLAMHGVGPKAVRVLRGAAPVSAKSVEGGFDSGD
ncbi:hypothetical protein ABZ863_11355 [Saccharomonospora sp. NPDC046836]|uniref:hypothetical protein n=1 Tax=Saccharomonospora sp. NPDC046836 TaxID=3156921 RepID=UPI0033EDA6C7